MLQNYSIVVYELLTNNHNNRTWRQAIFDADYPNMTFLCLKVLPAGRLFTHFMAETPVIITVTKSASLNAKQNYTERIKKQCD